MPGVTAGNVNVLEFKTCQDLTGCRDANRLYVEEGGRGISSSTRYRSCGNCCRLNPAAGVFLPQDCVYIECISRHHQLQGIMQAIDLPPGRISPFFRPFPVELRPTTEAPLGHHCAEGSFVSTQFQLKT